MEGSQQDAPVHGTHWRGVRAIGAVPVDLHALAQESVGLLLGEGLREVTQGEHAGGGG